MHVALLVGADATQVVLAPVGPRHVLALAGPAALARPVLAHAATRLLRVLAATFGDLAAVRCVGWAPVMRGGG